MAERVFEVKTNWGTQFVSGSTVVLVIVDTSKGPERSEQATLLARAIWQSGVIPMLLDYGLSGLSIDLTDDVVVENAALKGKVADLTSRLGELPSLLDATLHEIQAIRNRLGAHEQKAVSQFER